MRRSHFVLCLVLALGALLVASNGSRVAGAEAKAEKIVPPTPGATIPKFTLKDVHRRPRTLDGFKDKKAFVVVFIGTECPLVNLYIPTLIDLHKEYAPRGVQFLAINSNVQDTFLLVSAHAQERE